ncbi:hypothetical protein AIOL_001254 [Candidatus Rhodobacter oscarellae]|uniref:Hedgehog/Intein (Hint) domain-containing protein n=1 Tax=Candidatus Rhodobacter oscarellae TaxID=1675527 RepID=A0A0J9E0V5_9RHOB|nr:Hint domain-containing protein [Candidatus Rhodobacter lobularis]KMW56302.1 hypothetical protein AIOL_001254 [Candidatus Rhodobacter lobularis]
MADYTVGAIYEYTNNMAILTTGAGLTDPFNLVYMDADTTFVDGEDLTGSGNNYAGFVTLDVHTFGGVVQMDFPMVTGTGGDLGDINIVIPFGLAASVVVFPNTLDGTIIGEGGRVFFSGPNGLNSFTHCFAAGTKIRTTEGEIAVEALTNAHRVITAQGNDEPVKWVGRQTIRRQFQGEAAQNMVRITAGALGDGLPTADLTVTGDHGMVLDGMVVNASALVNGTTITRIPASDLPSRFTVYHVETEAHDVILAEGAPSETFIDTTGRRNYDNYAEYLETFGAERMIKEMPLLRISTPRLLPRALRERLGIATYNDAAHRMAG